MGTARQALDTGETTLPDSITEQILEIYRPEYRLVTEVTFQEYSLEAKVKPALYPYTQEQVFSYVTAPTANLIGCQLTYVLVGGLLFLGKQHPSAPDLNWKSFLDLRDRALLKFSSFKLDFRQEVQNGPCLRSTAELIHIKRIMGHTHTDIRFEIGKGVSGLIHGVILPR